MSVHLIIAIIFAVVLLSLIGYTNFQRRFGHYRNASRKRRG